MMISDVISHYILPKIHGFVSACGNSLRRFLFMIKYKLGLAREGVDFITLDQEDYEPVFSSYPLMSQEELEELSNVPF